MANTLTNLFPDLYEALDIVSREPLGFIGAVSTDNMVERAAIGETVRIPITPAVSTAANTAAVTPPNTGDQTIDNTTMAITKSKHVAIRWNGEEVKGMRNGGQYGSVRAQQFAQAFRALTNEIEADIAALYYRASRAYGTAGTTPFASSLADLSEIRKILQDNGAPLSDLQLVIDTAAGVKMRNLTNLTQVNTSGSDATLRMGALLPLFGFQVRESGQVTAHTKGTATGMDCTAIEPVGEVTIAVDGSDSGTILAGDVITRGNEGGSAEDTNKYVVASATASGAASGNIVINQPGLLLATAVTDEWTIGGSYTANLAFHRNAIQLATRMPALPDGGDAATDVVQITDPVSGITFEVAEYKQFMQTSYHVRLAWGVAAIKPEHMAILLG